MTAAPVRKPADSATVVNACSSSPLAKAKSLTLSLLEPVPEIVHVLLVPSDRWAEPIIHAVLRHVSQQFIGLPRVWRPHTDIAEGMLGLSDLGRALRDSGHPFREVVDRGRGNRVAEIEILA